MFEAWGEFYLLAGSAAAVLIGLSFVVVTLMQDRSRESVLAGSKLYMGPVVLTVSFVLAPSAAALAPGITPNRMAAACVLVAVWGLARGIWSILGIRALDDQVHWTDVWFYGAIPSLVHLSLGAVAWGFYSGQDWAKDGLAAVITAWLLLSIRNEWDLVTWLAPKADATEPDFEARSPD